MADFFSDFFFDKTLLEIARQYKDCSACRAFSGQANANPRAFAALLFNKLRASRRGKRFFQVEDMTALGSQFSVLNEQVAEVINKMICAANTGSKISDEDRVWCVARATTLGAVLLNTEIDFRFTGYYNGQELDGRNHLGHCWLVYRTATENWEDIDPSSPTGIPTDDWLRRRTEKGFNNPEDVKVRSSVISVVCKIAVGGIALAAGAAAANVVEGWRSPLPTVRRRKKQPILALPKRKASKGKVSKIKESRPRRRR